MLNYFNFVFSMTKISFIFGVAHTASSLCVRHPAEQANRVYIYFIESLGSCPGIAVTRYSGDLTFYGDIIINFDGGFTFTDVLIGDSHF